MIPTDEEYKLYIIEALYDKGIISDGIFEKCSKPHITSLPHDLRTTDLGKLEERMDVIDEKIIETDSILEDIDDAIINAQNNITELNKHIEDYQNQIYDLDYKIGLYEDWDKETLEDRQEVCKEFIDAFEDENGFNFPNVIQNNYDDKVKPVLDRILTEYETSILSMGDLEVLDNAVDLWEREFDNYRYEFLNRNIRGL